VFGYISDLPRHPEWASHKLRVESSPEGDLAAGARFVTVGRQLGVEDRNEVTVVEYEPPRRFVFDARSRDGRFRHVFELSAEGDATRLTKSMEIIDLSWPARIAMPAIAAWAYWVLGRDLKRIKQRLE
jgi:hypothetical protein